MRTTPTIDEDVAAKLKAEARRTGKAFRDVVNEALRAGLTPARQPPRQEPFVVVARDLGSLKPGLSLDSIANLVEQAEGPLHRSWLEAVTGREPARSARVMLRAFLRISPTPCVCDTPLDQRGGRDCVSMKVARRSVRSAPGAR
jgi:hypothetical protein